MAKVAEPGVRKNLSRWLNDNKFYPNKRFTCFSLLANLNFIGLKRMYSVKIRLDDCQSTHQDASCYIIAVSNGLLLVLGGVMVEYRLQIAFCRSWKIRYKVFNARPFAACLPLEDWAHYTRIFPPYLSLYSVLSRDPGQTSPVIPPPPRTRLNRTTQLFLHKCKNLKHLFFWKTEDLRLLT